MNMVRSVIRLDKLDGGVEFINSKPFDMDSYCWESGNSQCGVWVRVVDAGTECVSYYHPANYKRISVYQEPYNGKI
jgi:hypothetical protein